MLIAQANYFRSVGVVSCIRLWTLYGLLKSPDLTCMFRRLAQTCCPATNSTSPTGETTDALLWCAVELNLGITGGCVTAMRPFVRRYFPRLLGQSTGSGGEYYSQRSKRSHALEPFPRSDISGFADRSQQYSTTLEGGDDNESEEHILSAPAGSHSLGGILQTVEFEVDNPITAK